MEMLGGFGCLGFGGFRGLGFGALGLGLGLGLLGLGVLGFTGLGLREYGECQMENESNMKRKLGLYNGSRQVNEILIRLSGTRI